MSESPQQLPAVSPAVSGRSVGSKSSVSAVSMVFGGIVSVQFGAAIAALLFDRVGVAGVVSLRLGFAAVVLLVTCRPTIRGISRGDWAAIAGFGAVLAGMNSMFYQAIDRIPLGAAVTLEVLGPLTLSVVAAHRRSSWGWALLALGGVGLLGRDGFDRLDAVGVAFALGAAVAWAGYILLSARVGSRFPQADGLALALAGAAVVTLPLGALGAGEALLDPVTLGLGACVAVLSSVLPYTLELVALRRIATATFAVLMSLEPAVAALAGFLVLHQSLAPWDGLAIAAVVVACLGAVRGAPARSLPSAESAAGL